MVLCAACSVNNIDRHCTNTPRTCFQCCTTSLNIDTCPYHFRIMGNTEREARLSSGKVHPHILADAADGDVNVDAPAPPNAPAAVALPPSAPQGKRFVTQWNGVSLLWDVQWLDRASILQPHTDACVEGYAAVCGTQWFHGCWTPTARFHLETVTKVQHETHPTA